MIKVENLCKSFDGSQVLREINVEYKAGQCNMIIGASGSGKTVLLKSLIGLLEPDSGEIYYDGTAFSSMNYKEKKALRQRIGILFQGSALFDFETVLGNVMFPMRFFTDWSESKMRESAYLQTGCNNFKGGKCQPLGFWTEQDVLEYIYKFNLEIASVYGEVVLEDGKYRTTGESRTGCVACGYGCSIWKNDNDNRYLRLEQTHPKLHNHIINNLGFKEVLDYMNIKYTSNQKIEQEKVKLGSTEAEQLKWII